MDNNNASSTARGSQRTAEEAGRRALAIDIEDDLWRATALTQLANWIGKAQTFIAGVQMIASYDHAMKEKLKEHGQALGSADWDSHHAMGLEALHLTIGEHLLAVRSSADLAAASRSAAAPATGNPGGPLHAH